MTPTESLVLLIAIFYLIECFVWVPARSVMISLKISKQPRYEWCGARVESFQILGNRRGAFALAPVFLPSRLVVGSGRWDDAASMNLSPREIQRRLRRLDLGTRSVRMMALLLACAIFLWFVPLTLFYGLEETAWLSLPPVALLHLGTLFCFWRAHSRFYPEKAGDRWQAVLEKFLLPPANVRVTSKISLPYFRELHPVALLYATARGSIVDFARECLRDGANERTRQLLENALVAQGRSLDSLAPQPERESADARSYCPRCGAQFALDAGMCPDCNTVTLRPFNQG